MTGEWHISKRQLAIGLLVFALGAITYVAIFLADYKLNFNAANLLGKPEADAIAKLGPPGQIVTAAEAAARSNEQWWGDGWTPAPNRPVSNEVLVYHAVVSGALVFIGPKGTVEFVQLIGN